MAALRSISSQARVQVWGSGGQPFAGVPRGGARARPAHLHVHLCVPRKQEELVQQVRKRLEEALMADMLAHVEELARDGGAPLGEAGVDDDEDEDDEEEEGPDQDPDLEHV